MINRSAFLVILVLGCGTSPGMLDPAAAGGTAGAFAVAKGGAPDAAASGGAAWVDTFDPSGCEHPAVAADCREGWCRIPAGCFIMGSPDDEWMHPPQEQRVKTTLSRAFAIQQTEVTQAQWTKLGFANPSGTVESGSAVGQGECLGDDCPVGNVNWFEAVSYANLLSERSGLRACYVLKGCKGTIGVGYGGLYCDSFEITAPTIYECEGYRLPTDPEWEYAARAGAKTAFYNGDIATRAGLGTCVKEPALDSIAWYCSNEGKLAHPVAQLTPNAWGLYDVLGNVREWSNDQADWFPVSDALTDPDQTMGPGVSRHTHGCSRGDAPPMCRLANRVGMTASIRLHGIGFRLARTQPE